MTEAQQSTDAANEGVQPTVADEVTDPSMAPVTDDASGQIDVKGDESPKEEDVATQLGDFA